MENKLCPCCKTEIIAKSIKADELYIIRSEWYSYHNNLDEYGYLFYVRCRNCNSLIKITIEEAKEILNNCGYECEYDRWHKQLNLLEITWKDDHPNNFKVVDYYSGFNPNDIFKLKVKININADIIFTLANARKHLNVAQSILNDNKADRKCQNAYDRLYRILYDFDGLESAIKRIINDED